MSLNPDHLKAEAARLSRIDALNAQHARLTDTPDTQDAPRLGVTFGELLTLQLPEREEIIFGLGRGEMGLVNAVNNAGKTTLLRNLMVSLCTGRPFPPLGNFSLPKRVAFLDLEDSLAALRQDLRIMLAGTAEQARFNDNALLVCEARLQEEDLSLSQQFHFFTLTKQLVKFAPDLIIVDTIASAFQIRNENDNAEVRAFITRPLRQLAKDCNAALLAAHHIGKSKAEEGQTREASHKGRGASSFADMARLVLNLEKDAINDTVILSCAKVKGQKFADTVLRLDLASRWFTSQGEKREPTNHEMFLEVFADGQIHGRAEVDAELDGVLSKQSITRFLAEAVKSGKLTKLGHGKYRNAQMLTPIRDEHLSISASNNASNGLQAHAGDAEKGREHFATEIRDEDWVPV